MSKILTTGTVLGVLALAGTAANVAGYPVLGTFLSDPNTAATASNVLNGVLALVAGFSQGIKQPA